MVYLITAGFIVFDFITGTIAAIKQRVFNSSIMREGLFTKCGSICCVSFGVMVDFAQPMLNLGVNVPVGGSIASYICLMECGSIIENFGKLNPAIVPEKLKQYFSKLNND